MRTSILFILGIVLFSFQSLLAQDNDTILTIDEYVVTLDEFERIYRKNNSSNVLENKPVDEYMELFINYKLKVIEAKRLDYDKNESFITELDGYKEQLANPYFEDKEITEELILETYNRMIRETHASHILLRLDANASPKDTAEVYNRLMNIRNRIEAGEPFDKVASETSDDQSAATNGGDLGWFGAFRMVYPFEDAAFKTPVGKISMPVRTQFGYHIIKNHGFRDSKGSVRLAHILIIGSEETPELRDSVKARVYEAYEKLKAGEDFANLAAQYSDDRRTSTRGGEIRQWVNSGNITPELEEVVFGIQEKDSFSQPVAMNYGFHIFKLLEKKEPPSLEEVRADLQKKIMEDDRGKRVQDYALNQIKKEYNYREYAENIAAVADVLDESIYQGSYDLTLAEEMVNPVFTLGITDFSQKAFIEFITKVNSYNPELTFKDIINLRYPDFVHESAFTYARGRLGEKHPEFRYLMKEYHDGILLFNLTDDLVWSKASKDTTGLKAFYEKNKSSYMWGDRARMATYHYDDPSLNKKVMSAAKGRTKKWMEAKALEIKICGSDTIPCVKISDKLIEKGLEELPVGLEWKKGSTMLKSEGAEISLVFVHEIIPTSPKALNEARGLITADYQTYLEQHWLKELRERYTVKVNEELLKKVD